MYSVGHLMAYAFPATSHHGWTLEAAAEVAADCAVYYIADDDCCALEHALVG